MIETKNDLYVISADVKRLMVDWSVKTGLRVPSADFFDGMLTDLKNMIEDCFPDHAQIIPEDLLRAGIEQRAANSKYPIISIDRAYSDEQTSNLIGHLDVTRVVGRDMNKREGLFPREGALPIDRQLESFRTTTEEPVVLLDDVVFTGKDLPLIMDQLKAVGRPVREIIVGIGIRAGLNVLENYGLLTRCVLEYEDVVDEVCERDFLAGVPFSGRTFIDEKDRYWGIPYFKPFGDPESWATIPADRAEYFSEFCLEQSVMLWSAIEKESDQKIPAVFLPRRVSGLDENRSVVEALKRFRRRVYAD